MNQQTLSLVSPTEEPLVPDVGFKVIDAPITV